MRLTSASSISTKYAGSMKITTHMDHISHCKTILAIVQIGRMDGPAEQFVKIFVAIKSERLDWSIKGEANTISRPPPPSSPVAPAPSADSRAYLASHIKSAPFSLKQALVRPATPDLIPPSI